MRRSNPTGVKERLAMTVFRRPCFLGQHSEQSIKPQCAFDDSTCIVSTSWKAIDVNGRQNHCGGVAGLIVRILALRRRAYCQHLETCDAPQAAKRSRLPSRRLLKKKSRVYLDLKMNEPTAMGFYPGQAYDLRRGLQTSKTATITPRPSPSPISPKQIISEPFGASQDV